MEGEELYLYLVASTLAVGAAQNGRRRKAETNVLCEQDVTDAESRYIDFERIPLALRVATKKFLP